MKDLNELENEIKQVIISVLNLEDYSTADIESESALFNDGLGLDSIDALELGIGIKSKFKIDLDMDTDIKDHFYSVRTLANYISSKQ